MLANAVQRRQASLRRALPDSIDLLTICMEAGWVRRGARPGVEDHDRALADELDRPRQEVQLGRSGNEAMRNLSAFALAVVQADVFRVSVANVLRIQVGEMRVKRRQLAEERTMKVPIRVLFPVLFVPSRHCSP